MQSTISIDIVDDDILGKKLEYISQSLKDKSVVVAYSGGVDSSVVAYLSKIYARETRLVMQTGSSVASDEVILARKQADLLELSIEFIDYDEVDHSPAYRDNDDQRCYHCKHLLFGFLNHIKDEINFDLLLSGTNASDLDGHRPGHQASKDLKVFNPLVYGNISKPEVRHIARQAGLPSSDKPASACLASRIMTGIEISKERLYRIERAEKYIRDKYMISVLRVRDHGDLARIEVGINELHKILPESQHIVNFVKDLGFSFVVLDKQGYRPSIPNQQKIKL